MTDKEFDNAIKAALASDEVSEELNRSLIRKAQARNKKAKIYTFTKFAAAIAAVFICAASVLSVYNSNDGEGMKQDLVKKSNESEAVIPEISPTAARSTFDSRNALALSDLFNEGYDYKSVINEKIKEQINSLPNSQEYKFLEISENVRFSLDEQDTLTVIFDEGEITSSAHGEQYFTVGKVTNGVLN